MTQIKAQSCEIFDFFTVVAVKSTFRDGLINFFLKTPTLAELPRLGSSLFHSTIVEEKNIFKKVMFSMK